MAYRLLSEQDTGFDLCPVTILDLFEHEIEVQGIAERHSLARVVHRRISRENSDELLEEGLSPNVCVLELHETDTVHIVPVQRICGRFIEIRPENEFDFIFARPIVKKWLWGTSVSITEFDDQVHCVF